MLRKVGKVMKILILLMMLLTSCSNRNNTFTNQEIIDILSKEGYVTTLVEDEIVISKNQKSLIIYFTENDKIVSSSFYHSDIYPDWIISKKDKEFMIYDYNLDSLFDIKGKLIEGSGSLNDDQIKLLPNLINDYENFYYEDKYIKTNNINIKQIEDALLDYYISNK